MLAPFNILDARGAISVTERVGVIARVRALAVGVAKAWMDQQYGPRKKTEIRQQNAKPAAKDKKGQAGAGGITQGVQLGPLRLNSRVFGASRGLELAARMLRRSL